MQELFAPDSASTPEETFVLNNEQLKLLEGFLKLAGMMLRTGRASLLLYDARLRQLYPFRTYQVNSAPRRTIRDRSRETRPLSRLRRSEFSPQPELMPVTALPSDPFDQLLPNYVYNAGSSLSYPIALDGQPYAFFKAEEREDGLPYTEREQTMLELLVSQLLLALQATSPENNSAGSNNPTLPGEDYLQAHLPGEIERARRHNFNLSLMSLGVNLTLADLLPNVPDPETRQAYLQDVISHVAREVRRNLRSFDVLCQIDGQEFAVVLPHTNEIEGYYVARKLINQLDNDISLSPTTRKAVSLAIGISTYPVLANNAPVLVKQSRQALAQARKTKMA
jgi:diguanylate cyclase (GGDEF)-like protein